VDSVTRNISIQATLENSEEHLRPGMFVNVQVVLPKENEVLAIPATAVLYAPYSDSVFVITDKTDEQSGQAVKVVSQQFVRLGEKRGDFISVLSGLSERDHGGDHRGLQAAQWSGGGNRQQTCSGLQPGATA
jgi:membrane fusion protein, multidrug efflux system